MSINSLKAVQSVQRRTFNAVYQTENVFKPKKLSKRRGIKKQSSQKITVSSPILRQTFSLSSPTVNKSTLSKTVPASTIELFKGNWKFTHSANHTNFLKSLGWRTIKMQIYKMMKFNMVLDFKRKDDNWVFHFEQINKKFDGIGSWKQSYAPLIKK